MAQQWTRTNANADVTTGARTTILPYNSNNAATVNFGDMILVFIATLGSCSNVSDNANGNYVRISTISGVVEQSAWYVPWTQSVAINTLVITATTTSANGIGYVNIWTGGDGRLDSTTAQVFPAGTSLSLNGQVSGVGNLCFLMEASATLETTAATTATGDCDVVGGFGAYTDVSMWYSMVGGGTGVVSPNNGDQQTGVRTFGMSGLQTSVARTAILVVFWNTYPVTPWKQKGNDVDTLGTARTSIVPVANANTNAILLGDLLLCWILTEGTCSGVSDNVNGAYTFVTSLALGVLGEFSLWYYRNSRAIGINSLTITGTTTSDIGMGLAQYWRGGDGSLDTFKATTVPSGNAISASSRCNGYGNLPIFMQASTGNSTTFGTATGIATSATSAITNGRGEIQGSLSSDQLSNNGSIFSQQDISLGLSGLGAGGVINGRVAILAVFWATDPNPGSFFNSSSFGSPNN